MKRFRCGRLIKRKDGTIKKLDLSDGGGARFCNFDDQDMDFHEIHRRLLEIFRLGKMKNKIKSFNLSCSFLYR
jgi:hypothetical protein